MEVAAAREVEVIGNGGLVGGGIGVGAGVGVGVGGEEERVVAGLAG
jgi:hypothetical protein